MPGSPQIRPSVVGGRYYLYAPVRPISTHLLTPSYTVSVSGSLRKPLRSLAYTEVGLDGLVPGGSSPDRRQAKGRRLMIAYCKSGWSDRSSANQKATRAREESFSFLRMFETRRSTVRSESTSSEAIWRLASPCSSAFDELGIHTHPTTPCSGRVRDCLWPATMTVVVSCMRRRHG